MYVFSLFYNIVLLVIIFLKIFFIVLELLFSYFFFLIIVLKINEELTYSWKILTMNCIKILVCCIIITSAWNYKILLSTPKYLKNKLFQSEFLISSKFSKQFLMLAFRFQQIFRLLRLLSIIDRHIRCLQRYILYIHTYICVYIII